MKAAVALLIVCLLAIFGISRMGGDTWTEVAAHAEWRAYTPPVPQPTYPPALVPVALAVAVLAAAAFYWFANRKRADADSAAASGNDEEQS